MYISTTQIRVRYGETDQMGYLYHGNYMLYYEEGRTEAIRRLGITYKELEAMNVGLPVVASELEYLRPAFYDDLITVKTTIEALPHDSFITFHTELYNEKNKLLNRGKTRLVFYDISARKKVQMPDVLGRALAPYFQQ